jgi:acetyltransferase-like isoleucine patch superfamily enzyme
MLPKINFQTELEIPIMTIQKKLWRELPFLRSILYSIYFNFHYLPIKQAFKLPILLYKPELVKLKGKIIIDNPIVKTGMIQFGRRIVSVFPNSGIMWENNGGTVEFKGRCIIGNNSNISIGEKGHIIFNDDFLASSSIKLISYQRIEFGIKTRVGWNALFMDTNFHPLVDMKSGKVGTASGIITIGDFCWFGNGCTIMHSVNTPSRCIFGVGSILTRGVKLESYCLHGGNPLTVLKRDIMRDYNNDREVY